MSTERDSLAQEIREGLRMRGFWEPGNNGADVITAVFKAIDSLKQENEKLLVGVSCGFCRKPTKYMDLGPDMPTRLRYKCTECGEYRRC